MWILTSKVDKKTFEIKGSYCDYETKNRDVQLKCIDEVEEKDKEPAPDEEALMDLKVNLEKEGEDVNLLKVQYHDEKVLVRYRITDEPDDDSWEYSSDLIVDGKSHK